MNIVKIIAVVAGIGGYLILLALNNNSATDIGAHFNFALFGSALGLTIYSPTIGNRAKTIDGAIAGIGVFSGLILFALLGSFMAVCIWFKGHYTLSYTVNLGVVVIMVASFGFAKLTKDHVDEVSHKNSVSSDHFVWQRDLAKMRVNCSNFEIDSALKSLIDVANYVAKDSNKKTLEVNGQIQETIARLAESVNENNISEVHSFREKLIKLLKRRELEINEKLAATQNLK